MTDAVTYESLTFTYPEGDTPVLHDVTLSLREGAFVLAVGPTGSGKSTFLRTANGLVPQFTGGTFAGHVTTGGRDTMAHAPRDLADVVAFVPQDPMAAFVMDRVEDELAYGMENLGVEATRMRRRVEEVLDLLAIAPLRDRGVRSLSGGERQRVAIAAALAAGPRLLVLDEPTSQLDPQGAEDVLAALQRLVHDHGMTALIAEHRLERVVGFADHALGFPGDASILEGDVGTVLDRLDAGPPVTRLGRALGWTPVPLTVRDARAQFAASGMDVGPPPASPAPTVGASLLHARDIEGGYDDRPVVRNIDLEVAEGEIVALMGRNGSGKSTLLRILAGLHEPSRGRALAARTDRPPRPGIDVAMCPQDPEDVLYRDSVLDEVATTIAARGSSRRPEEILERLGVADLAHRHPRDLSTGQRLLVATAAIVATDAPVLLLDEPTRGLDPGSKARLAAFFRSHAAQGSAAVFASHDVELVASVATRVVMLADGDLILDADPSTALGDSHVFAPQMTRVAGPGWLTVEQVVSAMRKGS